MNDRTRVLLALILLVIVGFIMWPRDGSPEPAGSSPNEDSTLPHQAHWSSGSSNTPSKLPRNTLHRKRHATHAPGELKDFIIPSLTTEDATVEESLAALFDQYNEICHDTGETPLNFTYQIKGEARSRFNLQLKQVSFLRALRIIAARSGLVLNRNGTKLVFSSIPLEPAESLLTSQSPVPPTFLSDLRALFGTSPAAPEDPFAKPGSNVTKPGRSSIDSILNNPLRRKPLIDQLRELGIVRSSNATVSYIPSTSTLVLNASPADRARLESFLDDELLNTRPVQLRTTTKFIESTKPITFEKSQFSEEEYQVVMRSLPQTRGVDIMTQPSVVSRPGQTGTIEIIREVVIPDPDHAGKFNKDWTGVRTQVQSGGYGFDLQSNIANEIRVALGDSPDTIKGVNADALQHHPAGHTVLIESTSPGGTPLYIFATTQRIDATGRPFDPRRPE